MTRKIAIKIYVFLFFASLCYAQKIPTPITFEAKPLEYKVEIGTPFTVTIHAIIDEPWHLYSILNDADMGPIPTQFKILSQYITLNTPIKESKATQSYDPNFNTTLGWHSNKATFELNLTINKAFERTTSIPIQIRYQACTDRLCLPPRNIEVISIAEMTGTLTPAEEKEISNNTQQTQIENTQKTDDSLLAFFWLAMTAGFAALLTPCVYPMIPLTVSYFSKETNNQGNKFTRASIFSLALIITFVALGTILAAVIGVTGAVQFASNPWVNLFIAITLVMFALSLFGMYEIQLPHQLNNWLNRKSTSGGYSGILFIALAISTVSFSCTAPFIGAVLALTAQGQWFYPIIGMFGFALAFSLPFILFALFPSWLSSLPQSGGWLNNIKFVMGGIELAAAIKFFSNSDLVWGIEWISRPLAIAAWITIFFIVGLFLLGIIHFKSSHQENKSKSIGSMLFAIPFLMFSFYLIPGLLGSNLGVWDSWLPPKRSTDPNIVYSVLSRINNAGTTQDIESEDAWQQDYDMALQEAKDKNMLMFIDFTGYTCTNCRAMETNVFPIPEVHETLNKYYLVRLYTDDHRTGEENLQRQFRLTQTIALPTYVILDPHNETIIAQQSGYIEAKVFLEFLQRGLSQ